MNEIRVNNGIVVSVNDSGDTITINADDQIFLEKFYTMIERIETIGEKIKSDEMKNKSGRERLQFMIDNTKEIMSDIDGLFGSDSCKKVFGDIVPSYYLLADFFDQIIPIVQEYANERQKKIADKYSRSRKGGRKYRTKEELIQDAMR